MNEKSLETTEYHPSADSAMAFYRTYPIKDMMMVREALASTALSGNRLSEICLSTIDRLDKGEPVSDRYLLGLCWMLRDMKERFVYDDR